MNETPKTPEGIRPEDPMPVTPNGEITGEAIAPAPASAVAKMASKRPLGFAIFRLALSVILCVLLVAMLIMMLTGHIVWSGSTPHLKNNTFTVTPYENADDVKGEALINARLRSTLVGAAAYVNFATDYEHLVVYLDKYDGATRVSSKLAYAGSVAEKKLRTGYLLWGSGLSTPEDNRSCVAFIGVMDENNDGLSYAILDENAGTLDKGIGFFEGTIIDDSKQEISENTRYSIYAWTVYKTDAPMRSPQNGQDFPADTESYVLSIMFTNNEPGDVEVSASRAD